MVPPVPHDQGERALWLASDAATLQPPGPRGNSMPWASCSTSVSASVLGSHTSLRSCWEDKRLKQKYRKHARFLSPGPMHQVFKVQKHIPDPSTLPHGCLSLRRCRGLLPRLVLQSLPLCSLQQSIPRGHPENILRRSIRSHYSCLTLPQTE